MKSCFLFQVYTETVPSRGGVRPGNPTPAHAQGQGSPAPIRPQNPTPVHAGKEKTGRPSTGTVLCFKLLPKSLKFEINSFSDVYFFIPQLTQHPNKQGEEWTHPQIYHLNLTIPP